MGPKNFPLNCHPGHFASWVVEMFIFGLIQSVLVGSKELMPLAKWMFFVLLPSTNYLVFPIVQALSSPDLRAHIFSLEFCKPSCLCPRCKPGNGADMHEVPEEIELQVVQNGHVANHL